LFFAENLKIFFERSRLSDQDFASTMGINTELLNHFLSGKIIPDANTLLLLSTIFKISIDALLKGKFRNLPEMEIRMLVIDVDGVMTDAGMYFSDSGDEIKKFNARDGRAIIHIMKLGIEVAFLSSGLKKTAVINRAERLGVKRVFVGRDRKEDILAKWQAETAIPFSSIAYIGDDTNDLGAMQLCGFTACPSDAAIEVIEICSVVMTKRGGEGCVREFCDCFF